MRHINADKKRIKEILKESGHTMINSSWYTNEDPSDATFNTYDKFGECYHWYVNKEHKSAFKQMLSSVCINSRQRVDYYFTEIFEEE